MIIPGILEKNWEDIEGKLEILKKFSKTAHIDFIDGKFASNTTFLDSKPFQKYSNELFLEAHLMVDNPLEYLESLATAGFRRFLGHIEKMPDITEFVARGQLIGEVGLAVDPETNIDKISVPFDDLDEILLMGVKAGASGQPFQPQVLNKIKKLREVTFIPIEVDGGVNDKTILDIKKAGADRFIATSFLFQKGDPAKNYQSLLKLTNLE